MGDAGDRRTQKADERVCAGIIATLTASAIITLRTVRFPRPPADIADNPTPLGYTRSLSLFVIPALVLAWWFLSHPSYRFQRRAFGRTLALLVPLGFLLDFLRASTFFTFENRAATLGIDVPVVGGTVPVEEFIFYVTGFVATLLVYLWSDEYWLGAYKIPDLDPKAHGVGRVVKFHFPSLLVGLVLIAAGFVYKRFFSGAGGSIPGYYIFLVALALVPSMFLLPTARPFINWRALSFTFFLLVLVSLLWEATLASPYRWWGYRDSQMVGLYVFAWGLPIEAVLVWMAVSYTTAIVYHVVKVFLALETSWREALFGRPRGGGT